MARFLSADWVGDVDAYLQGIDVPGPGADAGLGAVDGEFTVAQDIHGTPEGDVRLLLTARGGTLRLALTDPAGADDPGSPVPAVTITVSYEDAAAMSTGALTPAEALNDGRIRVRGDLSVLVAGQQMLATALAGAEGLREGTTY